MNLIKRILQSILPLKEVPVVVREKCRACNHLGMAHGYTNVPCNVCHGAVHIDRVEYKQERWLK